MAPHIVACVFLPRQYARLPVMGFPLLVWPCESREHHGLVQSLRRWLPGVPFVALRYCAAFFLSFLTPFGLYLSAAGRAVHTHTHETRAAATAAWRYSSVLGITSLLRLPHLLPFVLLPYSRATRLWTTIFSPPSRGYVLVAPPSASPSLTFVLSFPSLLLCYSPLNNNLSRHHHHHHSGHLDAVCPEGRGGAVRAGERPVGEDSPRP